METKDQTSFKAMYDRELQDIDPRIINVFCFMYLSIYFYFLQKIFVHYQALFIVPCFIKLFNIFF